MKRANELPNPEHTNIFGSLLLQFFILALVDQVQIFHLFSCGQNCYFYLSLALQTTERRSENLFQSLPRVSFKVLKKPVHHQYEG